MYVQGNNYCTWIYHNNSHENEMAQLTSRNFSTGPTMKMKMSVRVGTMVSGPTKRSRSPIRPDMPRKA